jgi:hypothetical protein
MGIPHRRLSPQQGSPTVGSAPSRALPLTADEEHLTYSQASMAIQAMTAWNLVESRLPEAEVITNTSDEARTVSGDTEGIPTQVLEKIVAAVRFNNRTSLTLPPVDSDVAHPQHGHYHTLWSVVRTDNGLFAKLTDGSRASQHLALSIANKHGLTVEEVERSLRDFTQLGTLLNAIRDWIQEHDGDRNNPVYKVFETIAKEMHTEGLRFLKGYRSRPLDLTYWTLRLHLSIGWGWYFNGTAAYLDLWRILAAPYAELHLASLAENAPRRTFEVHLLNKPFESLRNRGVYMPFLGNEIRDMEFRNLRGEGGDNTRQKTAQQLPNFRDMRGEGGDNPRQERVQQLPNFGDMRGEGGDNTSQERAQQLSNFGDGAKYCPHEDCRDRSGRPTSKFGRRSDLKRHDESKHRKAFIDCPKKRCLRKGTSGFVRRDKLTEHLRIFHSENIPKRQNQF